MFTSLQHIPGLVAHYRILLHGSRGGREGLTYSFGGLKLQWYRGHWYAVNYIASGAVFITGWPDADPYIPNGYGAQWYVNQDNL